jgi:hypothetical protein
MIGNSFDGGDASGLEQALRGRFGPEPPMSLRERVMGDVARALAEHEPATGNAIRGRGGTGLARWAAVMLIGVTLSRVAASATPFFRPPAPSASSAASAHAAADLLRRVAPGLTPDEADRMTIACSCRVDLVPMPNIVSSGEPAALLPGDPRSPLTGDLR